MTYARKSTPPQVNPLRQGQAKPVRITATQAKNEFGRVLDAVLQGGSVIITRHDEPKAILLSMEGFHQLTQASETALNTLSDEFDNLFESMQTPKARKAMQSAFMATPEELGKAAVIAARKRG